MIIVSESVFSMDGDVADLARLAALKNRFDCLLYVDEAHSIGLYGEKGLGMAEEQGQLANIDLLVGTFGKALASVGAFLLCSGTIREYLINHSRSLIFTTALPPVVLSWNHFIFKEMLTCHARRRKLRDLAAVLRGELVKHRLPTHGSTNIVPVMIGDDSLAVILAEAMQEKGYLIFPVRPPRFPKARPVSVCRLRPTWHGPISNRLLPISPNSPNVSDRNAQTMKASWLHNNDRKDLIVFCNGWGMDGNPFRHLASIEYDVYMLYDYRQLALPEEMAHVLAKYEEIHLIGWSMGVWAGQKLFAGQKNIFKRTLAMNGTLCPIHDRYGIPTEIFADTLAGFGEAARFKFYRRMCREKSNFRSFLAKQPQRSFEDQWQELAAIGDMADCTPVDQALTGKSSSPNMTGSSLPKISNISGGTRM